MASIFGRAFRTDVGTVTQTDFGYTGQPFATARDRRNLDAQGNSYRLGLMDYRLRFYDTYLDHFIQPDSIVAVVNASGGLVIRQEKNPTWPLATLPKSFDLGRAGVGLIFQDRISACLPDVPRQK